LNNIKKTYRKSVYEDLNFIVNSNFNKKIGINPNNIELLKQMKTLILDLGSNNRKKENEN